MSNLRLDTKEPYQIIYSLSKHPQLGYLIDLVAVKLMNNGQFGLQSQKIHLKTSKDFNLSDDQLLNLKIIDEISPEQIQKKFNPTKKEYKINDFYNKVFDEEIEKKTYPFIEKRLLKILTTLVNQNIYLEKDKNYTYKKIKIEEEQASVLFHFRKNEEATNYFITIKHQEQRLNFNIQNSDIIIKEPAWMLYENKIFTFTKPIEGKKIIPFLTKKYISIPKHSESIHFEKFVKPLIEKYDVYAEGFTILSEKFKAKPVLKTTLFLDNSLCLSLYFNYGNYQFSYNSVKMVSVVMKKDDHSYVFHRIARSKVWESQMVDLLLKIGFKHLEGAVFVSQNPNKNLIETLIQNQTVLNDIGFEIDQSTMQKKFFIGESSLNLNIQNSNDWFDLNAEVKFGEFSIPFIKLKHHILKGQKEFELPDGNIAIIPDEWFQKYSAILDSALETNQGLKIKKHHFGLLEEYLNQQNEANNQLINTNQIFVLPKHLNCQLRPYQIEGFQWLMNLNQNQLGACLADDMGLGKTLQILAFLQYFKEHFKGDVIKNEKEQLDLFGLNQSNELKPQKRSLIVVPTALVYNWKNEIEKFTQLSYFIYTGGNRTKEFNQQISNKDIIITSYGTLRNDISILKNIEFDFVILDEAQAIKNPSSQTAQSVFELTGKQHIAMTGTPIENSIIDLWSIFNFANKGLLGTYSSFIKKYQESIEKDKNILKINELRSIIQPFLKRRTKEQVAKDLPIKTEKTIFCVMNEAQKEIYDKTKTIFRNELLKSLNEKTFNTNRLNILNGLIRLRQIANHPKLFDENFKESSGKFDQIKEQLITVVNSGHQVLVFSQFVQHLKIVKEFLDKSLIKYLYIDGSVNSKKRQELVDEFQNLKSAQIFLIQLKSGGAGLNLTAADYVFILDPWWNPAVERQAMDRTHRIGQQNPVFVYKFISKETIEEKILLLQNKKQRVSEDILSIEEQSVNNLDENEIKNLLD